MTRNIWQIKRYTRVSKEWSSLDCVLQETEDADNPAAEVSEARTNSKQKLNFPQPPWITRVVYWKLPVVWAAAFGSERKTASVWTEHDQWLELYLWIFVFGLILICCGSECCLTIWLFYCFRIVKTFWTRWPVCLIRTTCWCSRCRFVLLTWRCPTTSVY